MAKNGMSAPSVGRCLQSRRSRKGAPSRKRCMVNGQMTRASNNESTQPIAQHARRTYTSPTKLADQRRRHGVAARDRDATRRRSSVVEHRSRRVGAAGRDSRGVGVQGVAVRSFYIEGTLHLLVKQLEVMRLFCFPLPSPHPLPTHLLALFAFSVESR